MTRYPIIALLSILVVGLCSCENCEPYGVRLSLGQNYVHQTSSEKLVIRFNTQDRCPRSFVQFYASSTEWGLKVLCSSTLLSFDSYASYVQQCTITHIEDGLGFVYSVFGWSGKQKDEKVSYKQKNIKSHLPNFDEDFRMVVLGDWGQLITMIDTYDPLTSKFEELLKKADEIDALLILGDVAYDLDSNNGTNFQHFIAMLSQVSTRWPIIFLPGNHERLTDIDRLVYGLAFQNYDIDQTGVSVLHLPHFNLLFYDPYQIIFLNQTGDALFDTFKNQIDTQQGLTIVAAHYPFRCSGPASDCVDKPEKQKRFFDYMISHNVPLYLGAHYHSYERNYPVKIDGNFELIQPPYTWKQSQPTSEMQMVSMINGIAGSDTMLDEAEGSIKEFTAAHSYNITGFGILSINENKLNFQQFLTKEKSAIDSFDINLNRSVGTNSKKHIQLRDA